MRIIIYTVLLVVFVQPLMSATEAYQLIGTPNVSSGLWLGDGDYQGYLEIFFSSVSCQGLQKTPICGGEDWTRTQAKIACKQLGYPNINSIAVTGGRCSDPPATISSGIEVSGCSGNETTFEHCQLSFSTCTEWGGVICTALSFCSHEICSNTSYCNPSSTCSNCTVPPQLNCICYAECDPPCLNGGNCTWNSTCQCPFDRTGSHCELDSFSITTSTNDLSSSQALSRNCSKDCQNGGNCTNGHCVCPDSWTGIYCEEAVCDTGFCLNGGVCLRPNIRCTCLAKYSGPRCETRRGQDIEIKTVVITDFSRPMTTTPVVSSVATTLPIVSLLLLLVTVIFKCKQRRKHKRRLEKRMMMEKNDAYGAATVIIEQPNIAYAAVNEEPGVSTEPDYDEIQDVTRNIKKVGIQIQYEDVVL